MKAKIRKQPRKKNQVTRRKNPDGAIIELSESIINKYPSEKDDVSLKMKYNIFRIQNNVYIKLIKHGIAVFSNRFYIYFESTYHNPITLMFIPEEILRSPSGGMVLLKDYVTERLIEDRIQNRTPPLKVLVK